MRGAKTKIFLKHPITNIVYNLKQASKISGVSLSTLKRRIKSGYSNENIWKPPVDSSKYSLLPKTTSDYDEEFLLNLIPNPTKFDLKFSRW